MRGRFITLEGGEGVGKSTQAALLSQAIAATGRPVVTTREPGGTAGAEALRALLMAGDADRWSARTEALLFAAARSDHVERVIAPALAVGTWVVCDRYIDSTRAYQGGEVGDAAIEQLHAISTGALYPDRTLLLIVDPAEAAARARARDGDASDRFAARDAAYHAGLNAAFQKFAHADPARFRVIDASADSAAVTDSALVAIADLL